MVVFDLTFSHLETLMLISDYRPSVTLEVLIQATPFKQLELENDLLEFLQSIYRKSHQSFLMLMS